MGNRQNRVSILDDVFRRVGCRIHRCIERPFVLAKCVGVSHTEAGAQRVRLSRITSVLSERPLKPVGQKTERGKILNPKYNICRDQPTSRASPLRINALLCSVLGSTAKFYRVINRVLPPSLTASVIRSSGRRSPRLFIPESVTSSQSVRSRRFT